MKKTSTILALILALSMVLALSACGSSGAQGSQASQENMVNIGITNSLSTINPLNMDWTFVSLEADSLMFLPLVTIGEDLSVRPMLAESFTTEDNIHFDVKLEEDAVWSDGTPVTVDDVIFTVLAMSSPEVANFGYDFSMFEGFGDEDGRSPSGAKEIEGLVKLDDKNMQFVTKYQFGLDTFINNVATWICILPSHVLGNVSPAELATYDWFNHPDVVDGPYFLDSYDAAHYISYHANENYFRGKPHIDKLNFRIVQSGELLAGLQSGEIDFVLPSSANFPLEDQSAVESLSGYTASYTDPIINQMTFFNTRKVTDARVRKAFVMGIDRQRLLDELLGGRGEVTDGFVCSSSPYYDPEKGRIPYDPEGAKALLKEAGWDGSQVLSYYVSSNDETMVRAVQIIQQQLREIGIEIEIQTVDFARLMAVGGTDEVDVFSVQYTITPTDYYADVDSLVDMEDSWTGGYINPVVSDALDGTQTTTDPIELTRLYRTLDQAMIEDVPMFSLYFQGNLGVVSDQLKNARPSLYGSLSNVEQWELQQ